MTDRPAPAALGPDVRALPPAAVGASALFQAYAAGDEAALRFYRWNPWSRADRAEAAQIAAQRARHRHAVADVLAEQNAAWGAAPEVLALVRRLRDPESVAVVTGQQLGLFAGPLYTVYKARTAVRLAERLERETGRPAVPVFWLADEDHDFAEIHRAAFADGPDVRTVTYEDGRLAGLRSAHDNAVPVGRIVLTEPAVADALRGLEAALPAGPHRAEALALARAAYVPGRTMRDAFARLLRALVPDVVLMSVDDARLKALAAPLVRRELSEWPETLAALEARSADLVAAGFHAQVAPSPVNLFWLEDAAPPRPPGSEDDGAPGATEEGAGRRLALDPAETGGTAFEVRGAGRTLALDVLLDAEPWRFSPNVVLRPLVQDVLLPTAAYVAGPGEAAYFAQLGPVYERFGVPMPVVEPRLSLTVVEPSVAKVLDRYGLDVADLSGDLAALWRRLALEASDADLDGVFADARARLSGVLTDLEAVALNVGGELSGAAGAARAAVDHAVDRLETKTVRVEKRAHADVRARLERAQAALWPGGALQERALGPLGVVARHGVGALADLVGAVPLDASAHYVVRP
ncbi:bacillithiol biosynthesis protein BshC [Rubrivirga litoralis]|uniref:Putative cysteine ligase BshC n=1 Tax=Rubrivirga litoralis TaxID=3075598 RepID=A0ABU3BVB7_9BACT|nr:bacillithiol biosynthesis BshC [Rubrivirga sp. F394]MDT0633233.1 bacillithiol biosynthesis BshC [Rubrivirga sp. F394]